MCLIFRWRKCSDYRQGWAVLWSQLSLPEREGMYLYVSKQYDVHYHCTCCLNRLEQLLKGLPLHGLRIYRYSRVHRYALYKQCFSQNKSQQKLWNSPLYCMLLCWYLLQINYRVVQSFGRRKLQQIWWFMTYLAKFYLPAIFILSDLLWKATNLLMFFLQNVVGEQFTNFLYYTARMPGTLTCICSLILIIYFGRWIW